MGERSYETPFEGLFEPCRGTGELGHHHGSEFIGEECHCCGGEGYVRVCSQCAEILPPDYAGPLYLGEDWCDACWAENVMAKVLEKKGRRVA